MKLKPLAVVAVCVYTWVSHAHGQADPWTGQVDPLRTDVAALKASAESIDAKLTAISAEMRWVQFCAWWLIAHFGYKLWADYHLGGKFHLGERRGD